ncbi:MAG: hypothetical protein GXN95_06655 [Methanococci archaeon]|nr:hypothetical protein [Methanococci archaeon]
MTTIEGNIIEFQKSITSELDVIKNRVRNLIGDIPWGEEGRYKEAILRNVIRRFLPSNLSIGTGFVVKEYNEGISNQIDIIIYDNNYPVLFSEGDFVIVSYKNVKGIIEVKTKICNGSFHNILKKAEENGKLIGKNIFNGIFSYEYDGNINGICNKLEESEGYVNHISLNTDLFIKFWEKEKKFRLYNLKNLSFSYFISNLLCSVCDYPLKDIRWFLFSEDKEQKRIKTISLTKKYKEGNYGRQ